MRCRFASASVRIGCAFASSSASSRVSSEQSLMSFYGDSAPPCNNKASSSQCPKLAWPLIVFSTQHENPHGPPLLLPAAAHANHTPTPTPNLQVQMSRRHPRTINAPLSLPPTLHPRTHTQTTPTTLHHTTHNHACLYRFALPLPRRGSCRHGPHCHAG